MKFASILWRLALSFLFCMCAWTFLSLPERIDNAIAREATATRTEATAAITETRKELLAQVDQLGSRTLTTVDTRLAGITQVVADATVELNANLNRTTARIDAQLTRTNDTLATVGAGLAPALTHVASITEHADEASAILFKRNALPAQILGLTAAAKITLGQSALTMREIAKAAPDMAQSAKQIERHVDGITDSVDTMAKQIAAPKSFWGKLWEILQLGGAYAHVL